MKKTPSFRSLTPQTDPYFLIKWYQKNKRALPWRKKKKNPYHIWVSEVMLQQTTVNTVIPYYEKFIKKFNTLESLARSTLEEVLPYWSGLGYYSRVKNLHRSAKIIYKKKYFPKTYKELLKLPGFGPYTARAVSSLAFNEKTGVLDVNVIRVVCRYLGFKKVWWSKSARDILQKAVDKWTAKNPSAILNQALMELGCLVCTVRKPFCLICPIKKNCQAFKQNQVHLIPIKKQKKEKEIWFWKPLIYTQKNKMALTKQHCLPVLKSYPLFPGKATRKTKPPKKYDFIHSITHHAIYVLLIKKTPPIKKPVLWINTKDLSKKTPSSLIQKILQHKKNY